MKKESSFKAGDIVELKSGGPPMTVADPDVYGEVACQWFSGRKMEKGRFPPESLKRSEDKAGK